MPHPPSPLLPHLTRRQSKILQAVAATLVALGLLLWWLLPLGKTPPSGTIIFSTGTRAGVYQKYGGLLNDAIHKDMPNLKVVLKDTAGSQENVRRVANGQSDFAIAAADAVENYLQNHDPHADTLRGVARLYDDYVQLVVPADSDIRTVEDLKGKRVSIGAPNSGVRLIADRVLKATGIDPDKDIQPKAYGIDTGPKLLGHDLDAFFWSGGLPTDGLRNLAEHSAIRFIPIQPSLVAKLHAEGESTRYYRATNMPASAYPSAQNNATVPTMAVSNLLITRSDVDPELVEWLTRTVINSRDRIGHDVHSAQLVDVRTAIYTDPVPLHEGARRYYRSVKP
ncbi:TAXI family TRAP transporter solute-binding subunit [Streptomyces griseorubiginosus]|uniref:TAXI family TRAP transporter solute-binding subunit n=1 Tax=Streptomyces griseorubiginosus TaxID=67304 RepID=UPI0036B42C57